MCVCMQCIIFLSYMHIKIELSLTLHSPVVVVVVVTVDSGTEASRARHTSTVHGPQDDEAFTPRARDDPNAAPARLPPFPALRLRQTIVVDSEGEKSRGFPLLTAMTPRTTRTCPERPMVGDVVEKTNDAAARAAPSSDATTPVQQGKEEEGVGSGPWQQQRTGALRRAALLLLRSRLPRRFLAAASGVESGTDGAGLSCHSHDVHVNCPPPSKR